MTTPSPACALLAAKPRGSFMLRAFSLHSSAAILAVAFAALACSSDDMGSTRNGGSAGAGASSGPTGGNATGSPTTGSTGSPAGSTGSGSGGASTGAGVTSGTTGSGGAGTGSGAGGAGLGTGGTRDAGSVDARADVPLPVCNYPNWVAGTAYKAGDIVMYAAKPYIALADNPGYDPTISTFFWAPYTGCTPPPPKPPEPCPALDPLLPNGENTFTAMFTPTFQGWVPLPAYSYASLCRAVATGSLTGFARSGVALQDKRELAAFFANVAIETAYLTFTDESGHAPADQDFHGRGSLQITGQAIYSEVGGGLGLNLVGMPQLASNDTVVWQTGLWYWMNHTNPSAGAIQVCHQSIVQGNFGQTVRIIKGDCGTLATRVAQYQKNCTLLNIDPGVVTCQ